MPRRRLSPAGRRRLFLAVALPITVAQAFITNPDVQTVLLLALLVTAAGLAYSAWRGHWSRRSPWTWMAIGLALWVLGTLVSSLEELVFHVPSDQYPTWSDIPWLMVYPFIFVGASKLVAARGTRMDFLGVLDFLLVFLAGVSFPGVLLIHHVLSTHRDSFTPLGTFTMLLYPVFDLGLVALLAWIVSARSVASPVMRWLGLAILLELIADTTYVWVGPLVDQPRWQATCYLGAVVAMTMGALHIPTRLPRQFSAERTHRRIDGRWAVIAAVAGMLPLIGLAVGLARREPVPTFLSAAGLLICACITAARLLDAVTQSELRASTLNRLAYTDELTRLPNRRGILEQLTEVMASSTRPVAVSIIDLDHFKIFNDTYGHHGGDELLSAGAAVWKTVLGESGTIGRLGGEEFLVILPGSTNDQAQLILSRMRRETPMGQTFSAGCTELAPGGVLEEQAEVLRRADAALYRAKDSGRARTAIAPAA